MVGGSVSQHSERQYSKRPLPVFSLQKAATYLADALFLYALHRKDVLSGGRQLHSRSDRIGGEAAAAAAAGSGGAAGGGKREGG